MNSLEVGEPGFLETDKDIYLYIIHPSMYLTILPASRSLGIDVEDQTHVECSFDTGSTFYELLENLPIRQP